jgi:hypothetical protein
VLSINISGVQVQLKVIDEIHIGGFTSERQQDTGFISFLVDLRNKI